MAALVQISSRRIWSIGITAFVGCGIAMACGFWFGASRVNGQPQPVLPPVLAASASSSDTMAMATGAVSADADGVFFLDFLTGDLQCLVYYPRAGGFGAYYYANVTSHLGGKGGKNAKYIMVTGQSIRNYSTGGAQPAASLVYVADVTTGMFAAYQIPWNRAAASANQAQSGPLLYVGGGPVRNFQLPDPQKNQPAAIVDPNQPKQP